jgi:glycosyltransferase 2 family protein
VIRALIGRIVALLLIGGAAWYLGRTIATNWEALRAFEWQVRPWLLAGSVVLHVVVLAWGVWVWSRVIRRFGGPEITLPVLLRIWFVSNLARYIPGKIFQFVAVVQLGRGTGMSNDVLLGSLLLHTGLALLAAVVVASWTVTGALIPLASPFLVGVSVTLVAVGFVHPALLTRGLAFGSRVLRRPLLEWRAGWLVGLGLLGLSIMSWLFYGIAYALLLASLTAVPLSSFPHLVGINALSFAAGYAAIVTPGGLGVREATMSGLLLPLLPHGVAALVALVSRLWTIAAELIGGLLVIALIRGDRLPGKQTPDPLSHIRR